MPSSFGQYQSGIAPVQGISEAGARIGQMAQQGYQDFGKSLAGGIQAYNDNSAKNDILTSEAEALGSQIQQYAQMFGDSPEHKAFADSLQPYIEQLAKVPSQSLTQKMGTVTSVKAGFANIGQQLQVFEMMRKEKLQRDYYDASANTSLTQTVIDPIAIGKGKVPYNSSKTYDQNIADFSKIVEGANGQGNAIDAQKAVENYKANIKAQLAKGLDIKGNPINPEKLALLQDQIASAEGIESSNARASKTADIYGMPNFLGKEKQSNSMANYQAVTTSVDQQRKAAIDAQNQSATPEQSEIDRWSQQKASATDAIRALTGEYTGKPKSSAKEYTQQQIEKMAVDAKQNYYHFTGDYEKITKNDGSNVWVNKKDLSKPTNFDIGGHEIPKSVSAVNKQYINFYNQKKQEAETQIEKLKNVENAKSELSNIDSLILQADASIQSGNSTPRSLVDSISNLLENSSIVKGVNKIGMENLAQQYLASGRFKDVSPENARMLMKELQSDAAGDLAMIGSTIMPQPSALTFGLVDKTRNLTKSEQRNISDVFEEWKSKDSITKATETGDAEALKEELLKRKGMLQGTIQTGSPAATAGEIALSQQKQKQAEVLKTQAEAPVQVANAEQINIGTRKREVAKPIAQQESELAGFFQRKYGYVPSGFKEMFKANTPEANFKTMETPYGAFMYDGKTWSQIKTATPMSAKQIGENAAYQFSNPDGSPKRFANSNVFLSGNFEGSPAELAKFRTEYVALVHSEKSIDRLIEINNMFGESMPWNAAIQGEAKALLPELKAALRTDIIGVGTVSNYEQELIREVVADPTTFFSLESSDRAKLMVIAQKIRDGIDNKPAVYGLSVTRQNDSKNVESNLRQSLLQSRNISNKEQVYNSKQK